MDTASPLENFSFSQPFISTNSKSLLAKLPCVDLIICRDCVQHLTDHDVFKLFANIKRSKSRYLLLSNYPQSMENNDIDQIYSTARITYRNLLRAPFNFPEPLLVIDEGFDSKALTLWQIDDLPDF